MEVATSHRRAGPALLAAFGLAAAAALGPSLHSAFLTDQARAGDETTTVPARQPTSADQEGERLLAAAAAARLIDREVLKGLETEGLAPSGPSDDAEFLRRACLDVLGVPPTEAEVREFLSSKDPGKRPALVERLLADPLYGDHLAELWARLLFADLKKYRLQEKQAVTEWLAKGFNEGRGFDWMVREVVTATGSTKDNPALAFTMRFRDGGIPADIAGVTSRTFLAVQIQCCQCHDHPYEKWKQGDFASFASFFNLVQPRPVDPADPRQGFMVEDPEPSRLQRAGGRGGVGADIRGAARAEPRFLDGTAYRDAAGATRRGALASWILDRKNPWFAKAMVNRVWSWYFGRGIVNPVDDVRTDNPPSHPALLDGLALGFAEAGCDPRFLVRAITLSKAYQRTSRLPEGGPAAYGAAGGKPDESALRKFDRLYGRGPVKPLTADQVFDSVLRVTGMDDAFRRANRAELDRLKAGLLQQFVSQIDDDETGDSEQWAGTIPQGLLLMNGPLTQIGTRGTAPQGRGDRIGLAAKENTLHRLLDDVKDSGGRVDRLYLVVLGRHPAGDEARDAAEFAARGKGVQGWEDLFWALINCSEFMSNH
jgi:hypothetical protein